MRNLWDYLWDVLYKNGERAKEGECSWADASDGKREIEYLQLSAGEVDPAFKVFPKNGAKPEFFRRNYSTISQGKAQSNAMVLGLALHFETPGTAYVFIDENFNLILTDERNLL